MVNLNKIYNKTLGLVFNVISCCRIITYLLCILRIIFIIIIKIIIKIKPIMIKFGIKVAI